MTHPPLIGLPGRRKVGAAIVGFHEIFQETELDLYFADYARAVMQAGGIPVHLPVDLDPHLVADRLDGVLLPGGTDIDPRRYDGEDHPEIMDPEPERDHFEFGLLDAALEQEIPVLGICRGMQIINVHLGGTLEQHVPHHSRYDVPASAQVHTVTFTPGSVLHDLYGGSCEVNSLHHQTVGALGTGIEVTGVAEDDVVEGFEIGPDVLAVQWHPELMPSRDSDPLFRWLIERSGA